MTSSGRELLKWIALVLMTGDHAAKVFAGGYIPVLSELGRVAFPLFALVMAYNMAQPGADAARTLRRLLPWALIAQPVHAWAFGTLLPLNVLWTFALAAGCLALYQRGRTGWAFLAFAAGGLFVDYLWVGPALVLTAWAWFDRGGRRFVGWLLGSWDYAGSRLYATVPIWLWLSFVYLCLFNGNAWALLALPVALLAGINWPIPRTRWAFYVYYVGHLALFAALG